MKVLTVFLGLILLFSCEKKEPLMTTPNNQAMPSNVGTYWVYEWNSRDASGNITSMGIQDTVRIIGDTLINGKAYISYSGTQMGSSSYEWYHRDSSGYVVDDNGVIQYSTVSFNDTLRTWIESNTYKIDFIMKSYSGIKTIVPAGSFNTIDFQSHTRRVDGQVFAGCGINLYVAHDYYDPSIGLIKTSTIFYSQLETNCSDFERVLTSYHIE